MKTFKEFVSGSLTEAQNYTVAVEVRDARKANDLARDSYRGLYKNDGSNVFVFKKESDKEDFESDLLDMDLAVLEESVNDAKGNFLTKKQKEFLNSFKKLYNIDLFEFVEEWRTTRKQFTILTDDIPDNDLVNLERFCHDKGVRYEPNGRKALAVWV